jgi:hypothetical protein
MCFTFLKRTVTFLLIYTALSTGVHAQGKVKGSVVDAVNGEQLGFANVFINNTTIGTNADENGNFLLRNIPQGAHELIVSFVGHQTSQTRIDIRDTSTVSVGIRLTPVQIKEVEIVGTRDAEWEKQLEKFKKLFLGYTGRSGEIKIVNPYALNFNEDKDGNFSTTSNEVLEIENYQLGYNLSYQMQTFIVTPSAYNIVGTTLFREMQTLDPALLKRWKDNRISTYEGSNRHLFKSIIDGKFEKSGFELFEETGSKFQRTNIFYENLDKVVSKYSVKGTLKALPNDLYKLTVPKRLEVHYNKKNAPSKYYKDVACPVSWIETTEGYLILNKNGLVMNYWMMAVSGDMTYSRVGEMLPRNYSPDVEYKDKSIVRKEVNNYVYLIEKPYVQTDRNCYYANDVLYFKGYMNYATPSLRDSLSRVLYVELINADKKVVTRKTLQIINGAFTGSLDILPEFKNGDYLLRAYSRWMLNYSPTLIFTRPLKILAADEFVNSETKKDLSLVRNHNIEIQTSKEIYSPRERIDLKVTAGDALGSAAAANISISVTDLAQDMRSATDKNILDNFQFATSDTSSLPVTITHRLQEGIDIHGNFRNKNGAGEEGIVSILEKKSAFSSTLTTSKSGEFAIENLSFTDTVQFAFRAKALKGDKPGAVTIDSFNISPPVKIIDLLNVPIIRKQLPSKERWIPEPVEETVTLKPVTVEADKMLAATTVIKKMANYSITGEWLRATKTNSLIVALQGRIPGLNILTFMDGKASPFQVVMFQMKHVSFFPGGPGHKTKEEDLQKQEPLILVNDLVVNYELGEGARVLQQLRPEQVERIDVYRSNAYGNYGPRGGNGIINIYTRNPIEYVKERNLNESPIQLIKVNGFSPAKTFSSIDYSAQPKAEDKPDYRATVYWNANAIIDSPEGFHTTFFATDATTKYRIVVEGVGVDGNPIRGEKIIQVRGK